MNLRARCTTLLMVAVAVSATVTACGGSAPGEGAAAVGVETSSTATPPTTVERSPSGSTGSTGAAGSQPAADRPTSSTAPTTTAAPTTVPTTATTVAALGPGASGAQVLALQARLAELGYNLGAVDGRYGDATASAVMAFQKVEQLSVDGVPGPETLARLEQPAGSIPRGGSLRIEIDLARQVLFVVDGAATRIFNTSTGNDEPFVWPDGTPGLAYTPTGTFAVYYRVDGVDDGALGEMYRPLYFHTDWAVHGSGYVPAYPASHGCARVSNADQNWIWDHIPTGTPVVVYD